MKKTITIELKVPLTTIVDIKEGMTEAQALALAEKQIVKQLEKEFPQAYAYGIADADVLVPDKVKIGQIVVDAENGRVGVVLAVAAKNIQVAFKNGVVRGAPQCFKLEPEKGSKDIQWARGKESKEQNYWSTGDIGYLVVKDGPAKVVVLESRGKYKCIYVGKEGFYAGPITESQLKGNLFDTLTEAKNVMEKRERLKK